MTPEEISQVKESWAKVADISDTAPELFYGRLFEIDPSLRRLFNSDMTAQGKKLMQMIGVAVANLHQLDEVLEPIQQLGRRHLGYKVKDEDYDAVGEALMWTLEKGLGSSFTEEVHEAWAKTYGTLATVMKEAAAAV